MWGSELLAIIGVIMLDIVLSGDNAVVIGTLAARLPENQRSKIVYAGTAVSVVARIILSLLAVLLLHVPGLQVIGGVLLLWVSWRLFNDLRDDGSMNDSNEKTIPVTFFRAMVAITVADLGMSLDNVLAVAGAAQNYPFALAVGLILSVAIMAVAAIQVAKLIERYSWIAWIGLALILFIACRMIYEGTPSLITYYHHLQLGR